MCMLFKCCITQYASLNGSFQYGKVALAVRTKKTSVTVCAQSGRRLHGHMRVVEHATVELLGQ